MPDYFDYSKLHTLVDLLRDRALSHPDKLAFKFLLDGETETDRLTYQQLHNKARAIATRLQRIGAVGSRALLLYPPGLEFIAAFFGCLYASVVAVPAYPPQRNQKMNRLQAIVSDACATVVLTTKSELESIQTRLVENSDFSVLRWLTTDDIPEELASDWQEPSLSESTLAFLQYTSGSTGTPKGVMVSHGNLLHNSALIHQSFEHTSDSQGVIWLPPYHDMGLIGGVIQPLYAGFPVVLMSPVAFLQQPLRWLTAISRYQATTSGGPDFAYDLACRKITKEQLASLDLSSWKVAFTGSEPIRAKTLELFANTFADCGFRRSAFYPCYGMAETTLFVSGGLKSIEPVTRCFDTTALGENRVVATNEGEKAKKIVGCGRVWLNEKIVIVNPESLTRCSSDGVGEIWVSGSSIAHGYWNRAEETGQTFNAYLADTGEGPFLRTGDLGFLLSGELFVTGRLKDVIIIRGRNHYPQDIELTVEQSHPALRSSCGAVFAVEVEDEERVVVACEVERTHLRKLDVDEVVKAIRQAVSEQHQLQVYAVLLLKTASIPKTSSGKIQRHACRAGFLAGSLDVVGSNILQDFYCVEEKTNLTREALLAEKPESRQSLLESYLQKLVATELKVHPSMLHPQQPLTTLGIDSLKAVELQNSIALMGITLPMVHFLQGYSISQLAVQAVKQIDQIASLINPVDRNEKLPLSFAQERLWFIDQLEGGSATYNIPVALHLVGTLNIAALEQAIAEIIRRHESLRTTFTVVNGFPVQVIASSLTVNIRLLEMQVIPEGDKLVEVQRLAKKDAQQPFNLSNGSLLRVNLARLEAEEHVLFITIHHIISDGWSMGIFIQELTALYAAFSTEKPSPLSELSIQYTDFAIWQRQWLSEEMLKTQLNYWKQQLAAIPILKLPTDRQRLQTQNCQVGTEYFHLNYDLKKQLVSLSQKFEVTPFMTLMAAFKTLLYRYTGQEDIVVGTDIANRNQSQIEGLIGFFVNQLVLRSDLSNNPTFAELLARVKKITLDAYAHQDLPFQKLVQELQPQRSANRTPLFQVKFILQNNIQNSLKLPELSMKVLKIDSLGMEFDLVLSLEEENEGLTGTAIYNADLFDAKTIAQLLKHFQTLLESILNNPEKQIASLNMLADVEIPTEFSNLKLSQKDLENLLIELGKGK